MGWVVTLPIFHTDDKDFQLMQTAWSVNLNPLLRAPLSSGQILPSVVLAIGANVINHKLSRMLQGWFVVDSNAVAEVYRSAPKSNTTLTLTSDAVVTVDIFVF